VPEVVATEVAEAEEAFQDNPEDLAVVAEDNKFLLKQAAQELLVKEMMVVLEVHTQV
jgi:hypothetical protein